MGLISLQSACFLFRSVMSFSAVLYTYIRRNRRLYTLAALKKIIPKLWLHVAQILITQ